MVVTIHDDVSSFTVLLACIGRLCVSCSGRRLQHKEIIIFIIANYVQSPPSTRLTRVLVSFLAISVIVYNRIVRMQIWHITRSTTEHMEFVAGLVPTRRTHVLTAFYAAVESQCVALVTRVAFRGADTDFHEVGVWLRSGGWWIGCRIQGSCSIV